ncbi:MAG: hypothetical protein KGH79_01360 [Patescibacteria group bacterium]|nr:hypothetical protein [Patescibacteria group bacterium]
MDYVHFLNLEYFILRVYQIFAGQNVDLSQIPSQTLALLDYIAWTGLGLFVLFFAFVIYARRCLHEVEHAGWHKRQEEIEALHKRHDDTQTPRNPRWEHVLGLAGSSLESDWRRAIIEADIMLDNLLTERGYRGESLGDKLKNANPLQFTTLDLAWKAHKVRNDIAHRGATLSLTSRDARATIDMYRRVFEEFDYL